MTGGSLALEARDSHNQSPDFNVRELRAPHTAITLDGANLTYVRNQPTAQLLFSIGKHRVSVFLQQTTSPPLPTLLLADRSGFHIAELRTGNLDAVAISDVDASRLASLSEQIAQAQSATLEQPK